MYSSRIYKSLAVAVGLFALLRVSPSVCQDNGPGSTRPMPLSQPRPDAAAVTAWKAGRFGMFIHFGLYSELGGVWKGTKIDNGYSEQIMANAPIPREEYAAVAKQFDPEKFAPDAIVALAKSAGMRYIVVTAKHHDGFAMFATKQSHFNIVDASPYHRDVVKELADACARGGLRFGVYYSTIDWNAPTGTPYIEGNSNPISDAHATFNAAQLRELLTGYGPLSEIWFDMGKPTPEQSRLFAETVHRLQQQTMVSGRVFNYEGDFTVMGDNEVPRFSIDEPWQTPASIFGDTWGYRSWAQRGDVVTKTHEKILELVTVASRGGNYILNIGPEGDGSIVPFEADVLHRIGDWLKPNTAAILGDNGVPPDASPFRSLDFGFATAARDTLYLFVRSVPSNGVLALPGVLRGVAFGQPHRLGERSNVVGTVNLTPDGAQVNVAALHLDQAGFMPVIAIPFKGKLRVQSASTVMAENGRLTLDAAKADHFLNYNGRGYDAPATVYKLQWMVNAPAGRYAVEIRYTGTTAAAAMDLVSSLGTTHVLTEAGNGSGTWRGEIPLPGGDSTVEVTPKEPFFKGAALPVKVETIHLQLTH